MRIANLYNKQKKCLKSLKVLVIDDTAEVLSNIRSLSLKVEADGDWVDMDIRTVHIKVNCGKFTKNTIERLVEATQSIEFDYIFSDYAFIFNKANNDKLGKNLECAKDEEEKRQLFEQASTDVYLTLADIKIVVEELFDSETPQGTVYAKILNEKILNHRGEILLYTNSPPPFDARFRGELGDRLTESIKRTFKHVKRRGEFIVEMHNDRTAQAEVQNSWDQDAKDKFKSAIVAANLDALLREEGLRKIIIERANMKFKRNAKVVTNILSLSIAIGIFGALWGAYLIELFNSRTILGDDALHLAVGSLVGAAIVFLLSFLALNAIDRKFSSYLEGDEA